MLGRRIASVAILLTGVLAGGSPVFAQVMAAAQLGGAVTDPDGGVLPGVAVTVTQTDTGLARTTMTGADGAYLFLNLPVGPYTLAAKFAGFTAFQQKGIVLRVGDARRVNVSLTVGLPSETVTVDADARPGDTRSSSVGIVISEEEVIGLPLEGRQGAQLVLLSGAAVELPVLTRDRQYPNGVAIAVAGGSGTDTLYLLDGGHHNDAGSRTGNPLPFPEALLEFQTESGVRAARTGMYTNATVNAVTRAGTNLVRGNVFGFARHDAFNALPYFSRIENGGLGRGDGLRRRQLGGTVGGPIVKDRLFFFAGLQLTDQLIAPMTTNQIVPTDDVLRGDFRRVMSAACRGGTPRTLGFPFVDNQVDPALFHPLSLRILQFIPKANPAFDPNGCGRYPLALPNDNAEQQVIARFDYQARSTHRVFSRYFQANYSHDPAFDRSTNPNMLYASGVGLGITSKMRSFAGGWDWEISPTLFATTRGSLVKSSTLRMQGNGLPTYTSLGVNVHQYTTGSGQDFFNGGTGGWDGHAIPGAFGTTTPSISQDFDWIRGAHSVSFGAAWARPLLDGDMPDQANGIMMFSGLITRGATRRDLLPLADFMLGLPESFSQGGSQIVGVKQQYLGLYAQDVWRISRNVTLSYGVRWEPDLAVRDQNGFATAFVRDRFDQGLKSNVYPNAPAGLVFPGDPGFPATGAYTNNRLNQFAPRAGFVWDPTGGHVQTFRGAFGRFYDSSSLWPYGRHGLNPPFGYTRAATPPTSCPPPNAWGCPINLLNPWADTVGGNPLPVPRPIPKDVAFPLGGQYVSMPVDAPAMAVTQWSLSYQGQLGGSTLFDMTYMGHRASGIRLAFEENPSVYIRGQCEAGQYGLTEPGPCSDSSTSNMDARRLLTLRNPAEGPYFGSVAQMFGGTGRYHGIRFTIIKRLSRGWSLTGNYTRSTCVNQGEPGGDIVNTFPAPLDPTTNEGPCDADRPHNLNVSAVMLSRGVGGGLLERLTRDWRIGFIYQARSGSPLTPSVEGDEALTGLAPQRPVIVPGVDPYWSGEDKAWVSGNTARRWFNMNAFAENTPGVWGDVPRGYLRGPSYWNADLALSRQVSVRTGQQLEVRIEVFNVFDHENWGNPNVTLGATNAGNVTTTAGSARIMQFAVKYAF